MREIVLGRVDQKINAGPWELRSQSFQGHLNMHMKNLVVS